MAELKRPLRQHHERTFDDVGVSFYDEGDRGYYTADFGLRVG